MDKYNTLGLYEHNINSYDVIKTSFNSGEKIVGIVHATGTGKSYNALQLAYDNKDKKIIYVVPSNGIIEHIKKIIDDNPNLNFERDFPNLEFKTYQGLTTLSDEELENIDCNLLIIDEFHHIGAPIWGSKINKIIETHPNIEIFGMTAYTIRDRGTAYERDMANPDTEELFSNKIVSRYDLCDAMIDGILPKPIYKTAYTNLENIANRLEEKIQRLDKTSKEYYEYSSILNNVKKRIHEAPSIPKLLKKTIKPKGKYIYFCPPLSEDGTNDIETIKKQAINWLKEIVKEEDIVVYTTTAEMGIDGRLNREAFYDDVTLDGEKADNKLRIMFAINQYNEGIHAPNIDGVIMGRGTSSDIIYFEQLGRALSVRGNTKTKFNKLEKYTSEELKNMCISKDIKIKDDYSKEELIEKLIAPTVIDLVNNYEFMKELENNLKDRIRLLEENENSHRNIKIRDALFDIEIEDIDLFEELKIIMDKITMTWEDYFELANEYYEKYGDLDVPTNYKTDNGVKLGAWISKERQVIKGYAEGLLTKERIEKLNSIGMIWDHNENAWNETYELAKKYYEEHGDLKVPLRYETEAGVKLGAWICSQRIAYKYEKEYMTPERINKLEEIGMIWNNLDNKWNEMYNLAKEYYEEHGNIDIPNTYKTEDGKKLGNWISRQRNSYKANKEYMTPERINKLNSLGMFWDDKHDFHWNKTYELAKKYYEEHGDLKVPVSYVTEDGINLGKWINQLRQIHKGNIEGNLSPERIEKLEKIGMIWDTKYNLQWNEMYELAKKYYEEHKNLKIPANYETENGTKLGIWISHQRTAYKNKKLTKERIEKLEEIEIIWNPIDDLWDEMYELAKKYYEEHKNLKIPANYETNNGKNLRQWLALQRQMRKGTADTFLDKEKIKKLDEIGMIWNPLEQTWINMYKMAKEYYEKYGTINKIQGEYVNSLGIWIAYQRAAYKNKKLTKERIEKLEEIEITWNPIDDLWNEMYNQAKKYYEEHNNLKIPANYETENGINLGLWISRQRKFYKKEKLTDEQIEKLESIKMIWDIYENEWNKMYDLAKEYYEKNNHLNIPRRYITEDGVKLGSWISSQRTLYKSKKLKKDQIEKLESIKIVWDLVDIGWNRMYELVKEYYEKNGSFEMSPKYTVNNLNLGYWVNTQKKAYKGFDGIITQDKIKKLDSINFKWFTDYTDIKLQKETITTENIKRKQTEILNRFYTILSNYNDNEYPSKEDINKTFIKQLNDSRSR